MSAVDSRVEIGRFVVPYRLEGPEGAPILVLSNSLGTNRSLWEPQMPAFRSRLRVLRYEYPGHGINPAPAGPYSIEELGGIVVGLLDHLGIERASLCGISLGGMVSMWVASRHASRVNRLVLVATAPSLPPSKSWLERAAQVRSEGTSSLLSALSERWFTPEQRESQPDLVRAILASVEQVDAEGYAGCCEAIANTDLQDELVRVSAPSLVLAGTNDPVVPPQTALAWSASIGDCSTLVLPRTAHLANLAHPELFSEAVLAHVLGPRGLRAAQSQAQVEGTAKPPWNAPDSASEVSEPLRMVASQYLWGEIWSRPQLDRRIRAAVALGLLAATGQPGQAAEFARSVAGRLLSPAEIGEILLQVAGYLGLARAEAVSQAISEALEC